MSKSRQKLDVILENKVVQKLKLPKNVNNKKCGPKIKFFNEKKFRKIRIIFDIENWLWKSEFCHFWQLLLNWSQDLKSFWWTGCWLWALREAWYNVPQCALKLRSYYIVYIRTNLSFCLVLGPMKAYFGKVFEKCYK